MFTSRAEFRLHLRADNADQRLTPIGLVYGLVDAARESAFTKKMSALNHAGDLLKSLTITPNEAAKHGLKVNADGVRRSAFELLSYPNIALADLQTIWPELDDIDPKTIEQVSVDAQYAVYLERQKADVDAMRRDEKRAIPDWMDYNQLSGLSGEMRQKLELAQPKTIAHAQKIEGITPAAITLILAVIKRGYLVKKTGMAS